MTEEGIIEWCLKDAPPNTKVTKTEKDGYVFYEIGELNIDKAARVLMEYIKFPSEKDESNKEGEIKWRK